MKVDFQDKKLAEACESHRTRVRAFGADRAARLQKRLTVLGAAANLEELRHAPGRFHALKRDRVGQFTADLDHPYRLVFVPVIPEGERQIHADGYVWSKITHIAIVEIADTHD